MTIKVGDIIHFPTYNPKPSEINGVYYLILVTRKKFYYDILCLNDGHKGTLYKYNVLEKAIKVA